MNTPKLIAGLLVACAALLTPNHLAAQDWPQWRGPNRDGKAIGFDAPQTWPQHLTQQWKVTVGIGDSTPALVGGRLYTFSRVETDEVITCLDAATGKTIWESKYPADYVVTGPPSRHPGTRSSPVVADGRICTLGVGGILSCLDAGTGKLLWRKQSTDDYLGAAYRSDSSMSPVVVDGLCIVHIGGKPAGPPNAPGSMPRTNAPAMGGNGSGSVIAFDVATGGAKWKWDGEAPAPSSPAIMTVGGTKQFVTFTTKSLIGLRVSDGKLLWRLPFEATMGNYTSPVIDGETLYYTGQGKGLFALKLEPQGDTFTPVNVWTNSTLGARFSTPVLKDGLLYGCTGRFFCADAHTGATLWTDTTGRGNSAALVDAGPVILATTVNSGLVAFKPDGKEYTELAKLNVSDNEIWAHPVVAGKRIYIKDHDDVTCWSLE